MSNVFIKCTLEDPKQECDIVLKNEQNKPCIDLGGNNTVSEGGKLLLNLQHHTHPQIPDAINVLTTEVHKNGQEAPVSHKQSLGYIPEGYVKYLAPFLNEDAAGFKDTFKNYFDVTIHRIDTNACGSDGITIKICVK